MTYQPDAIESMLRDAGIRVTSQRRTVIAALVHSHDHPTAEDVHARAKTVDKSVSFATVYRALATLVDAAIVQRISVDDGPSRFEMAPKTEHDPALLQLTPFSLLASSMKPSNSSTSFCKPTQDNCPGEKVQDGSIFKGNYKAG